MISATRRWLRRNRNGIAITAAVVGATYVAGQYVLGKISEARERVNLDRIAKDNLRRRFEQNQKDCTYTVLQLLPTVTEDILRTLPIEQLTHELQRKKAERLARAAGESVPSELSSGLPSIREEDATSLSSVQSSGFVHASQIGDDSIGGLRRSKAQLWNEIKISSITRSFTLLYTLSLLTLLTRIQLNLLGRLNYLSSVVSLARPPPPGRANSISLEDHDDTALEANPATSTSANFGNDFDTNRHFLTFSWFLLHRGYKTLLAQIQDTVSQVFEDVSPTEPLSMERLSELTLSVRKAIEGSTESERNAKRWLPYLLPPREEEEALLIESGVITPPPASSSSTPEVERGDALPAVGSFIVSSGPLRSLLDETADLIDSPTFTRVHTLVLNSLFSHLIDTKVAQQAFTSPPRVQSRPSSAPSTLPPTRNAGADSPAQPAFAEPKTVKLATILAVLTRQAHVIGSSSAPPNDYVTAVENEVRELEAFAAVIYASNLDAGLEDIRSRITESPITGTNGVGVSAFVEDTGLSEMLESTFEGAWSKIIASSGLR